jgi:O-succinylbenzoate synthase
MEEMKIESVTLYQVQMPLLAPFTTSFGTELDRPCVIVEVTAGAEHGYGECVAMSGPWYSYETVGTALHVLREWLVPRLLSIEVAEPEDVSELFASIRGHNMAKAGLEMACWDLFARVRGVPLATLLGGTRDRVAVGVSVGIEPTPEALLNTVDRFLGNGYGRIKLKIEPGRDVAWVRPVRERYQDILLQVDANSAYTLNDAPIFEAMDDMNLLLIEQPLDADDIIDHVALQRRLKTPICLDESIHSPADARHALDLGSCGVINIKAGRVGGLRRSREIHDLCRSRDIPVWCGGMLETNIGRAHNVALASLPGFSLPGDISASARYYARDIAAPGFELNADSTLTVPTGPGIGVELDREALASVTERKEVFDGSLATLAR